MNLLEKTPIYQVLLYLLLRLGRILLNLPNLLNSENNRLTKTGSRSSKECEFRKSESIEAEELVSLDEIFRRSRKSTVDLTKLTASLLTYLRSLESLENLLPFSEEWVKRIHTFEKKKAIKTQIGSKEYTLNGCVNQSQNSEFLGIDYGPPNDWPRQN